MLSVSLFGDFRIILNDTPIKEINTPRLQSLVAYLLLNRDAPQSRSYIAQLFWPDTSEPQARTNLRNLIHHLRQSFPEVDRYLDSTTQTLQWQPASEFTLDVSEFESALYEAEKYRKNSNKASYRKLLEKAFAIYSGELLPSCYDDWIIPRREELNQQFITAANHLVHLLEAGREFTAAIRCSQRLLRFDPLQETTYRDLMRLHALNGDRIGGLRVFHQCATMLQNELQVHPGKATQEAYEKLLGLEEATTHAPPLQQTGLNQTVGRTTEWEQILNAWRSVSTGGGPQVILLKGEAGIGKTRLIEDLLQWANRQGIVTCSSKCYASEGALSYAPVSTWLRAHPLPALDNVWLQEIARILPEIFVHHPDLGRLTPLTDSWQRERFLEGLAKAVISLPKPLLMTVDDLQWCDRETLEWLHFLLRYSGSDRILIVGSYRPEEAVDEHPLRGLIRSLQAERKFTEIDIGPLDAVDTCKLASRMIGEEISTESAGWLYLHTEGNPLFVVETIRSGVELPALAIEKGIAGEEKYSTNRRLPQQIQSVLEARLDQLTRPSRDLAGVAAVIGREFSVRLLMEVSGIAEDEFLYLLDELWKKRIVREHGADDYDFSHDRLREVAYYSISEARRRSLHNRVAASLEHLHLDNINPLSRQLAAHYEKAGRIEQSVYWYLKAARLARELYANEDAILLLNRGNSLLDQPGAAEIQIDTRNSFKSQLWEELGDIHVQLTRYEEAVNFYHSAISSNSMMDQIWKARLLRKEGAARKEQRFYEEALNRCKEAELTLGTGEGTKDTRWWDEWLEVQVEQAWAHYWLANWNEMDAILSKIRPVVEMNGDKSNRIRLLWVTCLMHLRKGRYVVTDEMLENSHEALQISRELGDNKYQISCQFEYGFLELWKQKYLEAEQDLLKTLDLVEKQRLLTTKTLCLNYLTTVYRFLNAPQKVEDFAARTLLAAQEANMPDYVAAARGHEAWLMGRAGKFDLAEQYASEAIRIWEGSPLVYPFQWLAIWPLIGALQIGSTQQMVWNVIPTLLDEKQQQLPPEIDIPLRQALRDYQDRLNENAHENLDAAVRSARSRGYL